MGLSQHPAPAAPGHRVTIGSYRITDVIGQGGMGVVYAAEHVLLGRPAAVKVLLADVSKRQDFVLRFFNEARAAAAIRHPGIVEIYDLGWSTEGAAYIVMERLQGESLARRATRGRLPWRVALAVARQIAGALAPAHRKGIIHHDLKPDNIFLVPDRDVPGYERIKLLDFGLAKLTREGAPAHVTRTGAVTGTPTYMAPEQCRGGPVDHRADLYALGCLIFKLCTGRAPFVGPSNGDVLAAHLHKSPPRLGASVPDASPELDTLIERLLAKRPEDRPQSAEEVIQQIDAAMRDSPRSARRAEASKKLSVAGTARPTAPPPGASAATTTTTAATTTMTEATMTAATVTTATVTTVSGRGRKAAIWLGAAIVVAAAIFASLAVATCDGPASTPGPPSPTATGGR